MVTDDSDDHHELTVFCWVPHARVRGLDVVDPVQGQARDPQAQHQGPAVREGRVRFYFLLSRTHLPRVRVKGDEFKFDLGLGFRD